MRYFFVMSAKLGQKRTYRKNKVREFSYVSPKGKAPGGSHMKFAELIDLYEVHVSNQNMQKRLENPAFVGSNVFGNHKSALLFFLKCFDLTDQTEVSPYFDSINWTGKYDKAFKKKVEAGKKNASVTSNVRVIARFFQTAHGRNDALTASSIGERIRRARELKGLRRNDVAVQIGLKCDGGQIRNYEKAKVLKDLRRTRKRLAAMERVLEVPSGTFTKLLISMKGTAQRTDRGMGKFILSTYLTYAFRNELPMVMKKQFEWYAKFKSDIHLEAGLYRTTRWTQDQKGKRSTELKNKSHLQSIAGYACLPKEGKRLSDEQWSKISKFCTQFGITRSELVDMQRGEGLNPETISITDLANKELLVRYDEFHLKRLNLLRRFSGESISEKTTSTVGMHLVTIEHLFEPRHGGATQNPALFNTIGKHNESWRVFCLNINQEIAKLRKEIEHRTVEKDTSYITKLCCNPEKPLEEIFGFLKAFDEYSKTGSSKVKARRAAYYLLSNFPLRINSIDQLKTSSLKFDPPVGKKPGEVTLTIDKEILKNGRNNKTVNLRRDSKPSSRLWLMDTLFGTDTYAVLKDYVDNVRPKLDGADGPYLFPGLDRTAPFVDTERFTPSKLKFGWHSFRHFVATHVRRNFPEGRGAAANFLINTERMIDKHYGSMRTEDIQSALEKQVKQIYRKGSAKSSISEGSVAVHLQVGEMGAGPEPKILDVLNKLGGIVLAKDLPDETLDLLLMDYSDDIGRRVKAALQPLKIQKS